MEHAAERMVLLFRIGGARSFPLISECISFSPFVGTLDLVYGFSSLFCIHLHQFHSFFRFFFDLGICPFVDLTPSSWISLYLPYPRHSHITVHIYHCPFLL